MSQYSKNCLEENICYLWQAGTWLWLVAASDRKAISSYSVGGFNSNK